MNQIITHKNKHYFKTENGYKEIIASTDKSLGLPEPSEGFIKAYIEAYNSGNPIIEVNVEYEYYPNWNEGVNYGGDELSINRKENTINIKVEKDTFSREEVEGLITKALTNCQSWDQHVMNACGIDEYALPHFEKMVNEWIKNNL